MSDNSLATGSAECCPGCGYREAEGTPFTLCPRCGLVIGKYLMRHPPISPDDEPIDVPTSVAGSESAQGVHKLLTLVGAVLRSRYFWAATGLLLLTAAVLTVKYAAPLVRHNQKKAAQEQELKLFRAVGKGDQGLVRRLLLTGVNPNALQRGLTPVEVALRMEEIEIAEILLEHGARFSVGGKTLHGLFLHEVNRNNTKGAQFLLRHGADANAASYPDHSVLCSAAAHGNIELVLALLNHGANINFVGERGNTPLISAAYRQQLEVMKLLLERGVNVSPRNAAGYTPLRIAREKRNGEMVTLLTNAGAIE